MSRYLFISLRKGLILRLLTRVNPPHFSGLVQMNAANDVFAEFVPKYRQVTSL